MKFKSELQRREAAEKQAEAGGEGFGGFGGFGGGDKQEEDKGEGEDQEEEKVSQDSCKTRLPLSILQVHKMIYFPNLIECKMSAIAMIIHNHYYRTC